MSVYDSRKVVEFYNAYYCGKLVGDFVHGNERMEGAIRYALKWIPNNAKQIVDIGCGIGWSSHEIKRHFPQASVVGMDISEKEIQTARKLFQAPGLSFFVKDITLEKELLHPSADCIVMLDVYEHIPLHLRRSVHQYINNNLNQPGRLILTLPSISQQEYLRKHSPEGLQPVDENVSFDDILNLAKDIDGKVSFLNHVTVWDRNDYVYAMIERKSKRNKNNDTKNL